jgi:predicted alpha/beta superfamily hydrolase
MKTVLIFTTIIFSVATSAQNLLHVSSGKIEHIENFPSRFVTERNIDIWLPENYNPEKKYGVVYMHDGQMLFDSTQTWNKKEWKVDEVLSSLLKENKIGPSIVVGIWNTPERITEYFPNKIFQLIDSELQKTISEKYGNGKAANGDNYLKFITTELKPYIDSHFSTYTDIKHTSMAGSSMGGLISVYAISEYPDIFGSVACLSTAWFSFFEPNYAIPMATFKYLEKNLPSPENHKIYFDYGTGESDEAYELTQSFIDLIAKGKGYNNKNYKSAVYEKHEHEEKAWSSRLHVPFEFLLSKE